MKKISQAARKASMGYERHPANCGNCANFERNKLRLPAGTSHMPGKCLTGGFVTFHGAVCDCWIGQRGEVLETAEQIAERL
jgi:hypothetical protein